MSEMTSEESMLKCITSIATKKHMHLNEDHKVVNMVIRGLVRNKDKYGRALCPCQIRTGNDETDRKIECPCTNMVEDVNMKGHCKCNLYFKGDNEIGRLS